jgi:hypothetical protein
MGVMINRLVAGVLVVLSATSSLCDNAGRISVVGPDTVNFGDYPAGERRVARYAIQNDGTGDLNILKVRKTCGCASATCSTNRLVPGAKATVEVVILPNTISGNFSKNTFVESTDPANRFLRLNVSGKAIPLVKVSPDNVAYAGRVKLNTGWEHTFRLEPTRGDVVLGEPEVQSLRPVDISLAPSGGSSQRLHVRLLPTGESGDFQCGITVPVLSPTNHPPIKLSALGRLGYALNAVPGILYLPVSDEPVQKTLFLHVAGQRTRKLRPDELTFRIVPADAGMTEVTAEPAVDVISIDSKPDSRGRLVVSATFSSEFTRHLYAEQRVPIELTVPGAASVRVVCKIKNLAKEP